MEDEWLTAVGKRVKEIRKERGWNAETLSERAGISVQTVRQIESGGRICKIDSFRSISMALGVSADFLLGLDEPDATHNILSMFMLLSDDDIGFITRIVQSLLP